MELLRAVAPPSQVLLEMLGQTADLVDMKQGQETLEKVANLFMQLEHNHQMLIQHSIAFGKKERTKAFARLKEITD